MANRATPPLIQPIRPFDIPASRKYTLPNGAEIHLLDQSAEQDVLRLELIVPAARLHEHKPLVSRATAKMLKMGTTSNSADALSELLDFYGTKLKISDGFDSTTIQTYCLHRHLPDMLDIMMQVLTEPTFSPTELEKFVKRSKEHLRVDLQKADFVAYRIFTELVFGEKHPYGYNSYAHLYDELTTDDLRDFYQRFYQNEPPTVVLTGKITPQIEQLIATKLGSLPTRGSQNKNEIADFEVAPPVARRVQHQSLAANQQAAIRIGRRLFNKQHPDYAGFFVLNTMLGGYFGARLMQNLREDKGYTYGIYSSIDDMQLDGYFCIDAEVGKDVAQDALEQIYIELQRLCDAPAEEDELNMVKNYLMGNYLNAFDGFFNRSNTFSDAVNANIPLEFLRHLADTTQNITAVELQQLAQKYLQKDQLIEVVVH
jgi:zinc protease